MQRQIMVKNRRIQYAVRVSKRARSMRLDAYYDGRFVLTVPRGIAKSIIKKFIREKANWMAEQIRFFRGFEGGIFFKRDRKHYLWYREQTSAFISRRLCHYNDLYKFSYNS